MESLWKSNWTASVLASVTDRYARDLRDLRYLRQGVARHRFCMSHVLYQAQRTAALRQRRSHCFRKARSPQITVLLAFADFGNHFELFLKKPLL